MLYPNVFSRLTPLFLFLAAVLCALVPVSSAQQLAPGLKGDYFSNPDFTGAPALTRSDAQLDFEWQDGSPDALIPAENFSARWTGFVTAPVAELFTVHVFADDAVRVRVGGIVIWDTLSGPPGITTQTAFLPAGVPTPIEVSFRETTGWAAVRLAWSSLSQGWQIIPAAAFSQPLAAAPAATLRVLAQLQGATDVEVLFTEPVTGLDAADFTAVNMSIASVTGSGSRYVVRVTTGNPAGAGGQLTLKAGAVTDTDGNTNAQASLGVFVSPPPPNPILVQNPGPQTTVRGAAVNLRISGTNFDVMVAQNLPAGLTMDPSGLITGIVAMDAVDTSLVTVTARKLAPVDQTAATQFTWTTTAPAVITERGLKAEYFSNATLSGTPVLTRTEQSIYHEWQDGSPAAALPVDDFSARWSGTITARFTENYTFIVQADDAVRLWIGNTKVLDTAGTIGGGTAVVPMTAGQAVPVRLEFFETGGWASILFAWSSASQPWELVPASALLTGPPSTLRNPLVPVEKSLRLAPAGSDAPVLTFDRLAGDQSGMLVQVSPDLTAWQTIAADDPAWNITIDAALTPGYETVRVQRVPPAVSGPREFYRVILPPVVVAQ